MGARCQIFQEVKEMEDDDRNDRARFQMTEGR